MAKPQVVTRRRATLEDPPVPAALIQDPALRAKVEEEAQRKAEADGFVIAVVPKGFELTRDGHVPIKYGPGTQRMPKNDANHWFSKAQGVTIFSEA